MTREEKFAITTIVVMAITLGLSITYILHCVDDAGGIRQIMIDFIKEAKC